MKIQYSYKEIMEMLKNYKFVEVTFNVEDIKKKTSKIELIAFERKIKFELIYVNKKYDYLYDEIDPITLQIFDIDNKILSTINLEPRQDLLYLTKQISTDYDDLVMLLIPKNKIGLNSKFCVDMLINYSFLIFKVV